MDQPFIDQDSQEDNHEQNQIEIITTNENHSSSQQSQNDVSPPTPAYDSLQNMDEIIDKPSIDSDIQISTTQQPDIGAPSIQGQSPSQGVANPIHSNIVHHIQPNMLFHMNFNLNIIMSIIKIFPTFLIEE